MVGMAMAAYERFFVKPPRLTLNIDAWRILGLIFFLMVTDILANSFELNLEGGDEGSVLLRRLRRVGHLVRHGHLPRHRGQAARRPSGTRT